jgi:hypothetical protein
MHCCFRTAELFRAPRAGRDSASTVRRIQDCSPADSKVGKDVLIYLPANSAKPALLILTLNFSGNQTVIDDPCASAKYGAGRERPLTRPVRIGAATPKTSRGAVKKVLSRGYGFATIYYCDIEPDFIGGLPLLVHPLFFLRGSAGRMGG